MKIIFMGTPEFAVASLKALLEAGKQIVAVVTAPDKPAGRGQKLQSSAVKTFALEHNLPVLQPLKLRDPAFLQALKDYQADLQVVVAFRMLPEIVWDMPPKGTINLHASLLPQYRGAAPINHALINGETYSGVSTFLLQHEIDTGQILMNKKTAIGPNETAGELHDKLMQVGAELLVETIHAIETDSYRLTPQPEETTGLKTAPKIFKEDCEINWDLDAQTLHNFIRGLSPYPTAFTELHGKNFKIFKAFPEITNVNVPPGTPVQEGNKSLKFACKNGYIHVEQLQLQGKKE